MHQVAGDPDASASDIVEAGAPHAVARVEDGILMGWGVDSGGEDAGPSASAWRLTTADGTELASGLGPRHADGDVARVDAWPLADGFLVRADEYLHVSLDGEVEEVPPPTDTATNTTGADALVTYAGGYGHLYRNGRLWEYRPPGIAIRMLLDRRGNVWIHAAGPEPELKLLLGGSEPAQDVATPPLQGDRHGPPTLAGDLVVLPSLGADDNLVQLTAWRVNHPKQPPIEIPTEGLDGVLALADNLLEIRPLPDGRLVVGGFGSAWYVGTLDGRWQRLELPTDEQPWSMTTAGDRIYAFGDAAAAGSWVRAPGDTEWRHLSPSVVQ